MLFLIKNGIKIHMDSRQYGNPLIFLVGGVTGSLVIIGLSMLIDKVPFGSGILGFVGRNSLFIYSIHCLDYYVEWGNLLPWVNDKYAVPCICVIRVLWCLSIAFFGGLVFKKTQPVKGNTSQT